MFRDVISLTLWNRSSSIFDIFELIILGDKNKENRKTAYHTLPSKGRHLWMTVPS